MKKFQLSLFLCLAFAIQVLAQSNQYLHFDGTNDVVTVEQGGQYLEGATGLTMAGWFWTDQLRYGQGMMGLRDGIANSEFYIIQLDNGILECRFKQGSNLYEFVAPSFTIVPEQWQHVAWVYDGSKVILYIDGNEVGSSAASGTFNSNDVDFTIGQSVLACCDFFYGGGVDELSVWSKGLSQNELQDMMDNELNGDEEGLEMYFKFDQGVPNEDNTSIVELVNEVGDGERNGILTNFALMGNTSNFSGEVQTGFQAITFPQIPNKLISDEPFQLEAFASSGLPVEYEIVSGPASISGDIVTLDGTVGEVVVKASQAGDATYDPAEDLLNTFQVLDPNTFVPQIDPRSPLAGDVYVPSLSPIHLAAIAGINFPELFSVSNVQFEIDGETIPAKDWGNGHYTAWWTPPAYGSHTIAIIANNNYGAAATTNVNITVVEETNDQSTLAVQDVLLNATIASETVEAELPSYQGAFDQITATLEVKCPDGGCGEWDRVASVEAKGHNGQWVEIMRYITPYGTPCAHTIDLTDYMSILQGKIAFRVNCTTFDNGYLYDLTLDYQAGTPEHAYSYVDVIWDQTYDFGNPDNLKPVEAVQIEYPESAVESTLKLVSTGHGWGDNNTGNAAEFHEDTHHIWVNGEQTFEQHNWNDCNPNPDGCQPQNGTWFFDRAGWCPGHIAPWFDYDMTPFIDQGQLEMDYIFDEDYVDNCHPNNPNCVSGVTCPNCNDGFNPHLIVACNLIVFADGPTDETTLVQDQEEFLDETLFSVFPNPTDGIITLSINNQINAERLILYNNIGQQLMEQRLAPGFGGQITLDISQFAKGMYILQIYTDSGIGSKKIVIE